MNSYRASVVDSLSDSLLASLSLLSFSSTQRVLHVPLYLSSLSLSLFFIPFFSFFVSLRRRWETVVISRSAVACLNLLREKDGVYAHTCVRRRLVALIGTARCAVFACEQSKFPDRLEFTVRLPAKFSATSERLWPSRGFAASCIFDSQSNYASACGVCFRDNDCSSSSSRMSGSFQIFVESPRRFSAVSVSS